MSETSLGLADHLPAIQRYVANIAISGSSLRKQGAKGVVRTARAFLTAMDLSPLRSIKSDDYPRWLENHTQKLRLALPEGARNWGTARKALNIL